LDNEQEAPARARAAPARGDAGQSERETARATGIEEEHGELEVLIDDVREEADAFKSTEVERREVRRDMHSALVNGGRQARRLAMARQASGDEIEDMREVQIIEDYRDEGSGANEWQRTVSVGSRCLHLSAVETFLHRQSDRFHLSTSMHRYATYRYATFRFHLSFFSTHSIAM
jgi:hypothetical protein